MEGRVRPDAAAAPCSKQEGPPADDRCHARCSYGEECPAGERCLHLFFFGCGDWNGRTTQGEESKKGICCAGEGEQCL
jgi:hypothetical protein